ncbi:MAG: hypothetical protein BJ554DRAFT_3212, partial [Olpidium bornovanus]
RRDAPAPAASRGRPPGAALDASGSPPRAERKPSPRQDRRPCRVGAETAVVARPADAGCGAAQSLGDRPEHGAGSAGAPEVGERGPADGSDGGAPADRGTEAADANDYFQQASQDAWLSEIGRPDFFRLSEDLVGGGVADLFEW